MKNINAEFAEKRQPPINIRYLCKLQWRQIAGQVQPMTLMPRMGELERATFDRYIVAHPNQWRGVLGLWDHIAKASAAGKLNLPREDILFFATPHAREVSVNSTRVTRTEPLLGNNPFDLSYAEWMSRRQMRQIVAFLRKYVPGFEQAYMVQSGVQAEVQRELLRQGANLRDITP